MATQTTAPVAEPLPASRTSRVLIAVVRVGVALLWIQNAAWKAPPDFGALRGFTKDGVDHPVLAPWAWLVKHVILTHFAPFGWSTLILESCLGAFLLIGLATRLWALVGIGQTIAITLSVLYTPGEWAWSYFLMALAHLTLFATAAGRYYGLDGVLRPRWLAAPRGLPRLLARLS